MPKPPRLFVISPHLDDAVLGCAGLLIGRPGSIVCTVFSGDPVTPVSTPWDAACGFSDSREAMRARHVEDDRALALCGAEPQRLDFLDAQYGATPSVNVIADALASRLEGCGDCLAVCPLGLWHSDHELVGAACRLLVRGGKLNSMVAYEDAIYRAKPGTLDDGLARLKREGLRVEAASMAADSPCKESETRTRKRHAVQAYASQLRAFESIPPDVMQPERYWRITLG